MTREEEMITEFESEMNARLSDRDKELMISVMQWSDTHPKSKYNLSKVDSMRIKLESIICNAVARSLEGSLLIEEDREPLGSHKRSYKVKPMGLHKRTNYNR